jgi:hypothetical protein
MRILQTNVVLAASVGLLALPAAAQELTIVSKIARQGAPPVTATSYIGSDRMRANQGEQEFMAEFATGLLTMIDHKKKQYSTVTRQEMEATAAQMQAQMKQVEQQMANLPPEMRQKMSAAMGGIAQAISVQKGGGGRTIAGYSCQNWVITMGEMMKTEECVTTDLQYPIQAYEAQKAFSSAMAGPMGKSLGQIYDKFKEMKGVPLASTTTVSVLGKSNVSTTEVTEIKKGAIPASAWEIPAGYKKVDSPLAKMPKK